VVCVVNLLQFLYLCPTIKLLRPRSANGTGGPAESTGRARDEDTLEELVVDCRALMPDFPHFIDPDASPDVLEALGSQQSIAQLNILPLNLRALTSHMEYVLPGNTATPTNPAANRL
jgi:hypothetical protein